MRLEEAASVEVLDTHREELLRGAAGFTGQRRIADLVAGERTTGRIAWTRVLGATLGVAIATRAWSGARHREPRVAFRFVRYTSDDVYIHASAEVIQEAILHVHEDPSWWPGLRARGGFAWLELDAPTGRGSERVHLKLRIEDARPGQGFRWIFEEGAIQGHGEVWFEAARDGTIVHYLTTVHERPRIEGVLRAHRWAIRIGLNGLKDHLDAVAVR